MAQCADNYFHPRYRRRRRRHHHCRRHRRHRRAAVTGEADDERFNIPAGFCDACDLVVTKRQTDPRGKKNREKNIYMYLPRRSIYSEEGGSNIFIFRRTSSVDVYVTLAVFVNHRCH